MQSYQTNDLFSLFPFISSPSLVNMTLTATEREAILAKLNDHATADHFNHVLQQKSPQSFLFCMAFLKSTNKAIINRFVANISNKDALYWLLQHILRETDVPERKYAFIVLYDRLSQRESKIIQPELPFENMAKVNPILESAINATFMSAIYKQDIAMINRLWQNPTVRAWVYYENQVEVPHMTEYERRCIEKCFAENVPDLFQEYQQYVTARHINTLFNYLTTNFVELKRICATDQLAYAPFHFWFAGKSIQEADTGIDIIPQIDDNQLLYHFHIALHTNDPDFIREMLFDNPRLTLLLQKFKNTDSEKTWIRHVLNLGNQPLLNDLAFIFIRAEQILTGNQPLQAVSQESGWDAICNEANLNKLMQISREADELLKSLGVDLEKSDVPVNSSATTQLPRPNPLPHKILFIANMNNTQEQKGKTPTEQITFEQDQTQYRF